MPVTESLVPGQVTSIDPFLSAKERNALLSELRHSWWWDSPVIRLDPGRRLVSGRSISRTSSTTDETWFDASARRLLRRLERRLERTIGTPAGHFEPWQATRYRAGERFDEHHDSGFFHEDQWGERTASVIVYLTDSPSGGSTWFPTLRHRVQPLAGRAIVWPNLLPDGSIDERMRHCACPARRVKTILSTWVRELPTRTANERRKDG